MDTSVLVIDDNSTDCTGALADELVTGPSFVDVLHRTKKKGLNPRTSSASVSGLKECPSTLKGSTIGANAYLEAPLLLGSNKDVLAVLLLAVEPPLASGMEHNLVRRPGVAFERQRAVTHTSSSR